METKEITKEIYESLKKPLPKEAVKAHPTKTYLSSIKAIYVTERLNDVFGCGSWQIRIETVEKGEKGMVVVKATLSIPLYGVYYESYGGNDNGGEGSRNFDLGDAYKGATTDAITKIGSYMGIGIDVFKGKSTPPPTGGKENEPEKWLNYKDRNGVPTVEWNNVLKGIADGKITSVQDVRAFYKVSKDVSAELENVLNTK